MSKQLTQEASAHITYRQEMIKCGNSRCKKCAEGQRGHGPYWYAYSHKNGKTNKKYIGKNAPAEASKTTTQQEPSPQPKQPLGAPASPTSRSSRSVKTPAFRFWLIDEEFDVLGFTRHEEAELWGKKLAGKYKIYETDSKTEANDQHMKFLIKRAQGKEIWS